MAPQALARAWRRGRPGGGRHGAAGGARPQGPRRGRLAWSAAALLAPAAGAGKVRYLARMTLRYNVTTPAGGVTEERFTAAEFQRSVVRFVDALGPPPLADAFRLIVHSGLHGPLLDDCVGCLVAAHLLAAECLAYTAPPRADELLGDVGRIIDQWGPQPWEDSAWGLQRLLDRVAAAREAASPAPGGAAPGAASPGGGALAGLPGGWPAAAALDVVVAHCGEDVRWLLDDAFAFPPRATRLWVYEKCAQAPVPLAVVASLRQRFPSGLSVESVPNQGMESLAYARFLLGAASGAIEVAEYVLFLQADPFGHLDRGLLEMLLQAIGARSLSARPVPFVSLNKVRFSAVQSPCLMDLYRRLVPAALAEEVRTLFASYCCSQFLAHRARVATLSPERVRTVLRVLGDPDEPKLGDLLCSQDDAHDARPGIAMSALFENLWQVVLGERPDLPLRQDDGSLPLFLRDAHDWHEGGGPLDYHVYYQARFAY